MEKIQTLNQDVIYDKVRKCRSMTHIALWFLERKALEPAHTQWNGNSSHNCASRRLRYVLRERREREREREREARIMRSIKSNIGNYAVPS